MANKRKKPTTSRKTKAKRERLASRQKNAVILFGVAILLLFMVLIKGAGIWKGLHNVMFGLFGFCAYLVPFLIGYIAIVMSMKNEERISLKITGSSLLVVMLNTAIVTFTNTLGDGQGFIDYIKEVYSSGGSLAGGAAGGLVSFPLQIAVGSLCAKIIIIVLVFVFLMIVTGTTLGQLVNFFCNLFGKRMKRSRILNPRRKNSMWIYPLTKLL